jgi:hypothetical protein
MSGIEIGGIFFSFKRDEIHLGDQRFRQMEVHRAIGFDRVEVGAGAEQGAGQGAQPRADFDDLVAGLHFAEFERLADDVAVDQEVLTESLLGHVREAGQQGIGNDELLPLLECFSRGDFSRLRVLHLVSYIAKYYRKCVVWKGSVAF